MITSHIPDTIHPCPMCRADIASGLDAGGKPSRCDSCAGLLAQIDRNHAQRVVSLNAEAMSRAYVGPGRRRQTTPRRYVARFMVAVAVSTVVIVTVIAWALH